MPSRLPDHDPDFDQAVLDSIADTHEVWVDDKLVPGYTLDARYDDGRVRFHATIVFNPPTEHERPTTAFG